MTALTMVVGMLPTALAMTEGSETRVSMAWVIIGGMITSTVFTLIVIPIIFLWIQKHYPNKIWYEFDSVYWKINGFILYLIKLNIS